jgi:ATP synthase F1 complex assembly factor 2
MLDHRVLRTPARHPLIVPSRALALAIAAEWEWQQKRIQPFTMPLMSLAATALDEPKPREDVVDTMLQYLPTDSVLCRDEPGELADRQAQASRPAGSCGLHECMVGLLRVSSWLG